MAEPIAREARSRGLLRVRVDRVAPEGEGIGRVASSEAAPSAGKVVFVPHALPGEAVDAAVLREKSQYVRGRLMAVAEPSPSRVPPRCPHHFRPGLSEYCGGCDWQQASYEKQLELKRAIVEDCMARIAKLRVPVEAVLPSPFQWRYRNKVQVPFQPLPPPRLLAAGFYSPGSHRIVEFEDCVVQPELSVRVVRTVRDMARRFAWPIYDEKTGRGWLRHLFLRTNGEGRALAALVTRTPAFPKEKEAVLELTRRHPEIASLWQNVQMEKTSVILGPRWRKLYGSDRFVEKVGNVSLELSPGAFLQVNTPAAEILYRTAEELLFEGGFRPNLVLDLYSGAGVIALWIAPKVGRVIGVEESREAVADAYANARRLGMRHLSFIQGRVEIALRRMRDPGSDRPWGAVLDPPRAGCDPGVLRFLSERKVERVVYVSCNPATFARDARRLADSGYSLRRIQPVDLFPQTSHVELAALLDWAPTG